MEISESDSTVGGGVWWGRYRFEASRSRVGALPLDLRSLPQPRWMPGQCELLACRDCHCQWPQEISESRNNHGEVSGRDRQSRRAYRVLGWIPATRATRVRSIPPWARKWFSAAEIGRGSSGRCLSLIRINIPAQKESCQFGNCVFKPRSSSVLEVRSRVWVVYFPEFPRQGGCGSRTVTSTF